MKKLVTVFVVFALVATTVFAQDAGITVGGWGRGVFEPFKYVKPDGDVDPTAGAAVNTHWLNSAAVGVSFAGNSEKVGFAIDFRAGGFDPDPDTGGHSVGLGDNAYIWVKPFSILTIGAGQVDAGSGTFGGLRGKVNNLGGFAQAVHASGAEDDIFTGFGVRNGGIIQLTPIEGLTIAGVIDATNNGAPSYRGLPDGFSFKKLQIGAGYQIGTIGLLRAQFIGGRNKITDYDTDDVSYSYNRIEVAFALTAVDGLTLDIGGKIPLAFTEEDTKDSDGNLLLPLGTDVTYQAPIAISVGANFGIGDFSIGGRVDLAFGGYTQVSGGDKEASGFSLNALIEPAYDLGACVVGADIGVGFTGKNKVGSTEVKNSGAFSIDLGAWVGLNFSNGLFKAGVAARLPTTNYAADGAIPADKNPLIFSIPLVLEYFF
jgi:hypothetical protein